MKHWAKGRRVAVIDGYVGLLLDTVIEGLAVLHPLRVHSSPAATVLVAQASASPHNPCWVNTYKHNDPAISLCAGLLQSICRP
jgi:hypothetical protein